LRVAGGQVLLEQRVGTTPKAMSEVFGALPHCRIALEKEISDPVEGELFS
jgi:hypothetical protein